MRRFRPAVAGMAGLIACSLTASGLASAAEQSAEPPLASSRATATFVKWANFKSDKCLGIPQGNMTNGTKAIQWTCSQAPDQLWEFRKVPGINAYQFRNRVNPNKCLAVPGGSNVEGTQLIIFDCSTNRDQQWIFALVDDDIFGHTVYRNPNLKTGFYMAVGGRARWRGSHPVEIQREHRPMVVHAIRLKALAGGRGVRAMSGCSHGHWQQTPCWCGSGTKYKRCCGANRRPQFDSG